MERTIAAPIRLLLPALILLGLLLPIPQGAAWADETVCPGQTVSSDEAESPAPDDETNRPGQAVSFETEADETICPGQTVSSGQDDASEAGLSAQAAAPEPSEPSAPTAQVAQVSAASAQPTEAASAVRAASAASEPARPLAEGSYVFVAGTTRGKVLDVSGASKKPGANVIIWRYNGGANQKWRIAYNADGTVRIIGIGGNVIEAAAATSGANVRMAVFSGIGRQKWIVRENADGGFRFVSAANTAISLDVTGASGKDGANVEVWTGNASTAQKWTVQPLSPSVPASATVDEGWYSLQSSMGSSYYLDVTGSNAKDGTALELWTKNSTPAQAFRFFKVGGYYRIETGAGAGSYLDVEGGKVVPGTKAEVWRSTTSCTLFSLQRNADGSYRLVNVASGLALGVASGIASKGAAVTAELSAPGAKSQSFVLVKRPGLLEEGIYSVRTQLPGNRALGVKGASSSKGAAMAISSYAGSFHQKWQVRQVAGRANTYTVESIDTGYRLQGASKAAAVQQAASSASSQWWIPAGAGGSYLLRNAATGQLLDVSGASGKEGTAVLTWTYNGGSNQKWNMAPVAAIESGIYEFRSAGNAGVALDVDGASEADGANVLLWTRNGGSNQRWYYNAQDGTLVSMASGKALDVSGASSASGANVLQWTLNGGANQKWTVSYAGGGGFKISSGLGHSLVLSADAAKSGQNAVSATDAARASQRWKPVRHELVLASALKQSLSGVSMANVRGVGIDVSHWQGAINWGAVKNAGVDFAILRVGHGTAQTDTQFVANVRGCRANGIKFGVYYYSTARTAKQAAAEAGHALSLMRQAGVTGSTMDYAVYYDLEESSMGTTANRKLLADIASTFLGSMKGNGYKTGVYANLNWWNNYLTDPAFGSWERWVAQWRVSRCAYAGAYRFWQCTSDGSVPGISGRVDIDLMY